MHRFLIVVAAVVGLGGCGKDCSCPEGASMILPATVVVDRSVSIHIKVCIDADCADDVLEPIRTGDPSTGRTSSRGNLQFLEDKQVIAFTVAEIENGTHTLTLLLEQNNRTLIDDSRMIEINTTPAADNCGCTGNIAEVRY